MGASLGCGLLLVRSWALQLSDVGLILKAASNPLRLDQVAPAEVGHGNAIDIVSDTLLPTCLKIQVGKGSQESGKEMGTGYIRLLIHIASPIPLPDLASSPTFTVQG